jgi:hypothetical protein
MLPFLSPAPAPHTASAPPPGNDSAPRESAAEMPALVEPQCSGRRPRLSRDQPMSPGAPGRNSARSSLRTFRRPIGPRQEPSYLDLALRRALPWRPRTLPPSPRSSENYPRCFRISHPWLWTFLGVHSPPFAVGLNLLYPPTPLNPRRAASTPSSPRPPTVNWLGAPRPSMIKLTHECRSQDSRIAHSTTRHSLRAATG